VKKPLQIALLFVALLASVASAAPSTSGSTKDTLRPRAAFDMNCPQPQLAVTPLNETTYGVRGCNRQATYVWSCHTVSQSQTECDWMLNGGPYALAPAQAAAAPAPAPASALAPLAAPPAPPAPAPTANEPPGAPLAPSGTP
jgi:hypothetical protein